MGHVPNRLRIAAHFITVILLILEVLNLETVVETMVGVSTDHSIYLFLSLPIILGFLNAYNFMDGINGITVVNALVTLGTLAYLNHEVMFVDPEIFTYSLMGLLIFGFFNFRKKAACFAGDVGAVSIAFAITFTLTLLIVATGNYYFIALVLVYGVDSVGTIIERLIKRENIFQAHRSHLYQLMANQSKIPHLMVSTIYGAVQLLINFLLIVSIHQGYSLLWVFSLIFVSLVSIFAWVKLKVYRVFS
ncbi:MAG: UDP-GlcNAc--UDP-phosphate GlcNAc-1-phosphate transferase [Bacteroidota bacterium]